MTPPQAKPVSRRFVITLIAAHLGWLAATIAIFAPLSAPSILVSVFAGGVFGQGALLGAWIIVGRSPWLWRTAGALAGIVAILAAFFVLDRTISADVLVGPPLTAAIVAAALAILSPRWTVGPAPLVESQPMRPPQYALRHGLTGMAIFAVWLGALRAASGFRLSSDVTMLAFLGVSFALISLALIWAMLARRHVGLRLLLVTLAMPALPAAITSGLAMLVMGSAFPRQVLGHLVVMHLGMMLVVAGSLFALRARGYRLMKVSHQKIY